MTRLKMTILSLLAIFMGAALATCSTATAFAAEDPTKDLRAGDTVTVFAWCGNIDDKNMDAPPPPEDFAKLKKIIDAEDSAAYQKHMTTNGVRCIDARYRGVRKPFAVRIVQEHERWNTPGGQCFSVWQFIIAGSDPKEPTFAYTWLGCGKETSDPA